MLSEGFSEGAIAVLKWRGVFERLPALLKLRGGFGGRGLWVVEG